MYLLETWIFPKGADKRTWHDIDGKFVQNARGGAKSNIVLHVTYRNGFIEEPDLIKKKTDDIITR